MKKQPIIIDTDPGVDDALALIMMLKSKKFDIKLISATGGNVGIEKTTKNADFLIKLFNKKFPLVSGASKPIVKKDVVDASDVHASGGLGNVVLDNDKVNVSYDNILDAYEDVLSNSSEKIDILTLGPYTNLATIIKERPHLINKIGKVYSMIGSIDGTGNITKCAEFNAYFDAEAVEIVLNAGLDITFLPMQLGNLCKILKSKFLEYKGQNKIGKLIGQMVSGVNETAVDNKYFAVYDLHVPSSILFPYLYKFEKCDVTVSTTNDDTYAQMFMINNKNGKFKCAYIRNIALLRYAIFKEIFKGIK